MHDPRSMVMAGLQLVDGFSLLHPSRGLPSKASCQAHRLNWGQHASTQRHELRTVLAERQSTPRRLLCQVAIDCFIFTPDILRTSDVYYCCRVQQAIASKVTS